MQKYVIDGGFVKLTTLPQLNVTTPVRSNTDTQSLSAMD